MYEDNPRFLGYLRERGREYTPRMMSDARSEERVRQDIVRLCHAGLDSMTLMVEALARLRKVMPIDASFLTTADPATLLFTGAVVDDVLAHATGQFVANEFMQDDALKFTHLARSRSRVGTLSGQTQGELIRSPRYQEILAPIGLGDELRAALVAGSKCWGFMCLHRETSSFNFTAADAAFIEKLTPHLAEGLRVALLLGRGEAIAGSGRGPGLLLLGEDLSLAGITPAAEAWLDEIPEGDWPSSRELPGSVYAVAARLLALERGATQMSHDLLPRTRVRTTSRRWLVLHASRLRTPTGQSQIAVILEEAHPAEITPLIVDAYGLTNREGELTALILR